MKLRTLALAAAMALSAATAHAQTDLCADPAAYCGSLVAPACLQRVGAGSAPATSALPPPPPGACDAQMTTYLDCLGEVAMQCGGDHGADGHGDGGLGEGLGSLPPEVRAILEDPGAGLTGGAPLINVLLAARCSTPQSMAFSCEGAPAVLRFMLTSLSPNADLFRGAELGVYAIGDGAARQIADVTDQLLPVASGGLSVAARLDELPRTAATCLLFQRGRREARRCADLGNGARAWAENAGNGGVPGRRRLRRVPVRSGDDGLRGGPRRARQIARAIERRRTREREASGRRRR